MSWFSALPAGASTRSGSLQSREQRRAEIEAERLLRKQKSEQRKKLTELGVSAPASPSLSRASTPPPAVTSDKLVESAPQTPATLNMSNNEGGTVGGGGGNNNEGGNNLPGNPPPGGKI